MKRNVLVFVFMVLVALVAVPIKNIITALEERPTNWLDKSFLYNMDFASRWAATILYPFGISTDPSNVIIGKNGWLFLGDMYEKTLSEDRRTATDIDRLSAKKIENAGAAWNAYLSAQGVKLFRIMVGPNKGTVYPENMPKWARPTSPNPTDALLAADTGRYYIDLRPALLAGKEDHKEALYFKTDTHWNMIGAGIAFKEFARQVANATPDLKWPEASVYELEEIKPRSGGDLAGFLRMSSSLNDVLPAIKIVDFPTSTTHIDFDTKKVLYNGSNIAIDSPFKPLLVKSSGALNNKKVLWLRDSFGNSLSPLMAATFSDVIQIHWSEALKPDGTLARLVNEWQPDYVFVTVVERNARMAAFTLMPPPTFVSKDERFKVAVTASPISVNHLVSGVADNNYEINGDDAFVDFTLSQPVDSTTAHYMSIEFLCSDSSAVVPIQIFWMADGMASYDEMHSAQLSLPTGKHLLDLRTVPKWAEVARVSRVRIDIDAGKSCHRFHMSNPEFGLQSR
jgi:hypothetical protein